MGTMTKCLLGIAVVAFLVVGEVASYNVLFIMPFGSKSHKNVLDAVAESLVKKGHQITFVTVLKDEKPTQNISQIYIRNVEERLKDANFSFFSGSLSKPSNLAALLDVIYAIRDSTYEQPEFLDILHNPQKYKFDVVIIDAIFNEFLLPVAHHLGVPAIYVSPSILFTPISWNMNIPYPYSYLSSGLSEAHGNMNFYQRVTNAAFSTFFLLLRHWYIFPNHDRYIHSVLPKTPPLIELERNVSFAMTHTHPAVYTSMPSMPYKIEFACAHCKLAKPLPKELADFFDLSGDAGVIFFSLGSSTQGDSMPLVMRTKIIEAFSKLPQRILWKYESELENLPKNIKLTKWAPQQDLLAHPKMRLFITHGGGLSTLESVYHGCPILGFPLSADQLTNMGYAKAKGFGMALDWTIFTTEELISTINLMFSDKRYKENALLASRLLKDYHQHPADKAAYWVEYVIRHKGAPHLKSAANHLNFFQYFLLDVIGVIVSVVFVALGIAYYLLKFMLRLVCKKKDAPKKKQKKH